MFNEKVCELECDLSKMTSVKNKLQTELDNSLLKVSG
jgi:hypothetical protein